jgi:hypothetical protein
VVDEPVKEFKHDDGLKRPLGKAYRIANNGAGVNLRVTSAGRRSSSLLYNVGASLPITRPAIPEKVCSGKGAMMRTT